MNDPEINPDITPERDTHDDSWREDLERRNAAMRKLADEVSTASDGTPIDPDELEKDPWANVR
ncbi:MAG: hypothetical protein WCC60_08465 [Ilumatobacteraceae bacterium]